MSKSKSCTQNTNLHSEKALKIFICLSMIIDSILSLTISKNSDYHLDQPKYISNHQNIPRKYLVSNQFHLQSNMKWNMNSPLFLVTDHRPRLKQVSGSEELLNGKFWIERYELLKSFQNLVGIRSINSFAYLCMDQYGNIAAKELFSLSVDERCVWIIKYSPFGVQFYNFYYFKNFMKQRYLATCYLYSFYLCGNNNLSPNIKMNINWNLYISKSPSSVIKMSQSVRNPVLHYRSIQRSITMESNLFCNQIIMNLTKIALFDIRESFRVIRRFIMGTSQLKWVLLRKPSQIAIKTIVEDIQRVVIFYGNKMQVSRIRRLQCSNNFLELCTLLRKKRKNYKVHKHMISILNKKLVRLLIPFVRLSYAEKLRWINNGNIFDFLHQVFHIHIPKKNKVIMATYFLQTYFNEINVFNIKIKNESLHKFYRRFFAKKSEEILSGSALTMDSSNIEILEDFKLKFALLEKNNICFNLLQKRLFESGK